MQQACVRRGFTRTWSCYVKTPWPALCQNAQPANLLFLFSHAKLKIRWGKRAQACCKHAQACYILSLTTDKIQEALSKRKIFFQLSTAQLWVIKFSFSLWLLLLEWRSAQVSSYTLVMTELMVLSTEHSYGRERNKYRTCTFSMDRWGPIETCSKSMSA